ncbi:phosphopyruvate hydratase [Candidatus Roizmanbacteria bacterium RIFCSPLOWO2_02_FULL_38_10]|uniref:Enolase n=1 Tax=Candidatus Roizmanbacteria bacterium RIFCSPLOWO2_02_FULL_38_10 TaxID=1802074 RepID=A0A1F7JME7_9BACT|nr:MAG: phosphopyruvate hydratase [Candidatus Roizmanbacteria bacterium RIFCSPLOWO2_02_FULL_38_10]
MKIAKVSAIQILDSRGNPTLKAYVELENGLIASASVPSGASTGKHEAVELRDRNPKKYLGQSVSKARTNVNDIIAKRIVGMNIEELIKIDTEMVALDGTENKSHLGANAILSVSLACCRALANYRNQPLWQTINKIYFPSKKASFPRLFVNIVNGGKHANWNFDIQEFIISPKTILPSQSVQISSEIFHHLGKKLKERGMSLLVGDEGGYSPQLQSNDEVFELIGLILREARLTDEIDLGIDAAASEFYKNGKYLLKKNNKNLSGNELIDYYLSIRSKYGVKYFEDAFAEDDWINFTAFTKALASEGIVIGDDLYCTNAKRLKKGIAEKATTAILIKVNQIGSLSETVKAISLAQKAGMKVFISHRSGEAEDSFIADLAYGCGADFIKTGSMSRSDRLAKYNRLLEIEALEVDRY